MGKPLPLLLSFQYTARKKITSCGGPRWLKKKKKKKRKDERYFVIGVNRVKWKKGQPQCKKIAVYCDLGWKFLKYCCTPSQSLSGLRFNHSKSLECRGNHRPVEKKRVAWLSDFGPKIKPLSCQSDGVVITASEGEWEGGGVNLISSGLMVSVLHNHGMPLPFPGFLSL